MKTHVGFVNEVIPPHIATSDNALHLHALCPSPVRVPSVVGLRLARDLWQGRATGKGRPCPCCLLRDNVQNPARWHRGLSKVAQPLHQIHSILTLRAASARIFSCMWALSCCRPLTALHHGVVDRGHQHPCSLCDMGPRPWSAMPRSVR